MCALSFTLFMSNIKHIMPIICTVIPDKNVYMWYKNKQVSQLQEFITWDENPKLCMILV